MTEETNGVPGEPKGTYIRYIDKNLRDEAMVIVGQALEIILEYDAKGLDLTLRQLYYQFVARGLLENDDRNYDKLGKIVSDGRLCGLLPWDKLIDHERNLMGLTTFGSPREVLKDAAGRYKRDLWQEQTWRPEVWIEKKALMNVVGSICNQLRVDFFATKGYNSQSEQWRAGRRFAGYIHKGQRPIVFHLGDRDPSGCDMTRDNRERLEMFAGTPVIVQRLALNKNQVDQFNPPPNPLKMKAGKLSDSRAASYVEMRKREEPGCDPFVSWELDALDPAYIRQLISNAVQHVRDPEVWGRSLAREVNDRERLELLADEFV
jgi:hypothetical protein